MTANWTVKRLEEACDFYNGLWKGEKEPFVNVGVIRNTNFTKEGWLDDSDIAYLDVESRKFEKRRLQYGDVILEKSGGGPKQAVGRVVLFDKKEGDFSFSNFTSAIRVRDPELLDFRFLHMFLHWTYVSGVTEKIQSNSTGIRNLDGNAYKAIEISFPRLKAQQRIVAILDEVFAGIDSAKANAERNLRNAREVFEGCLESKFASITGNDLQAAIGDVTGGVFTGPFGSLLHKRDYVENGIPLVNPAHISTGEIVPDSRKTVSAATATRLSSYAMHAGDIVIGRRGEMGRCAVVTESQAGWLCGTGSFVIRAGDRFNSDYLSRLLRSDVHKKRLEKVAGGAVMPNLSNSDLSSYQVALPTLDRQIEMLREIELMEAEFKRLESIYTRKLTALDELKQSLLHQAFSGQL